MTVRPRHLATAAYLLTEAFAWYVVLHVAGTAIAREAFGALVEEIPRAGGGAIDAERIQRALLVARAGLEAAGGPSLLIVLGAAITAYLFMRWVRHAGIPIEIAAPLGVATTLIAFHVLLHLTVARDLRIWESSAIVALVAGGASGSGPLDTAGFIARPDAMRVRYAADLWVSVGLFVLWIRFLIAGRGEVHYDRALRSFGIGFGALLVTAFFGGVLANVEVSGLIIVYFVLGIVTLALAHAARTAASEEITGRNAPWLVSVVATVGTLVGLALLLGLLALLDLDRFFAPVVAFVLNILGKIFVFVLTPFLWAIHAVREFLLGQADPATAARLRDLGQEITRPPAGEDRQFIPDWAWTGLKTIVLAALVWAVYRIARLLFQRVRRVTLVEGYAETREAAGASGGGNLLSGLFRRRRTESGFAGDWLRRHAVYRLYARMVSDAHARGLERRPGDTPIEFARAAGGRFSAPAFRPIGEAFDGARYGRHFPDDAAIEGLERELGTWEREHPAGGGRP